MLVWTACQSAQDCHLGTSCHCHAPTWCSPQRTGFLTLRCLTITVEYKRGRTQIGGKLPYPTSIMGREYIPASLQVKYASENDSFVHTYLCSDWGTSKFWYASQCWGLLLWPAQCAAPGVCIELSEKVSGGYCHYIIVCVCDNSSYKYILYL